MPAYKAPLRDMRFLINEVFDFPAHYAGLVNGKDADADTVSSILDECAKFCEEVLSPINLPGDEEGCHFENGTVRTPKGFKDAYDQYVAGGWQGLSHPPEFGGQGLPMSMGLFKSEMMGTANWSFTMYPGLSLGAMNTIMQYATPELAKVYMPPLVEGRWTGTMCLTEPQCGTDLGQVKSKAEPVGDGSYRITGTKIFISAGEHDLAENIIHVVLARLPDAPPGTRGISLFVVPKRLPAADGSAGEGNAVVCSSIEHKMGIKASATCTINFENSLGWMLGEPNKGLEAMFTFMNTARIGTAVQGVAHAELSFQGALAYAKDRRSMRALSGKKEPDKVADAIIHHADVRRMLLTQKAYAEGARAFTYWSALQIDKELSHADEAVRKEAADLVALLTPIIKAFLTDNAFESTNHAMQIYGGHGFISEWGMEQYVRDARINMIYEGTNSIQSLDLLGRKVLGDMGAKLKKFGKLVTEFAEAEGVKPEMAEFINPLADIGDKVQKLTMEIGMKAMQNPDEVGAAAVPYLRTVGHLVFSYFWARMARLALDKEASGDPFYKSKLATARFYFARLLPETASTIRAARAGSKTLMEVDESLF